MAKITIPANQIQEHIDSCALTTMQSFRAEEGNIVIEWDDRMGRVREQPDFDILIEVNDDFEFDTEDFVDVDTVIDQVALMESDITKLKGEITKLENQVLDLVQDKAQLQLKLGKYVAKEKSFFQRFKFWR